MRLFHVSHAVLTAGQILEPGSWGRVTRQFSRKGRSLSDINDAKNLVWETSLEIARRAVASDAPSRLNCVFACRTLADACAFRDRFRAGACIYLVESSASLPVHEGDYDLITVGNDDPFVDFWVDRAMRYWTQKPQGICEVVIGGAVSVIEVAAV